MADDMTRFRVIDYLLWELRWSAPRQMADDELKIVNERVNALLDELERIANVPNLPPRLR